jgi:uncharacterized protein YjbI with pentapeptide repeats
MKILNLSRQKVILEIDNLIGADLTGADLRSADLTGADLTDADLTDADLTDADLTDADLRYAYLSGADLTGADLTGADLTNAYLKGVVLPNGKTLPEYKNWLPSGLLTQGGKPLDLVLAAFKNHTWTNCPMAVAFGVTRLEEVPECHRKEASLFIALFDGGHLKDLG